MTQVKCFLYFSIQTSLFFCALLGCCSFLIVLQSSSRTIFIFRYLLNHVGVWEGWDLLVYHLSDVTPMNSLYFSEISPFCLCSGFQIVSSVCHLYFDFVCLAFCLTFAINYLFFLYGFWRLSWLERHSQLQSYKKDLPMFSFITSKYSNFTLDL